MEQYTSFKTELSHKTTWRTIFKETKYAESVLDAPVVRKHMAGGGGFFLSP